MSKWKNLPKRIISAIILIAFVAAALYFKGIVLDAALLLVGLLAIFEVTSALVKGGSGKLAVVSAILAAAMLVQTVFFGAKYLLPCLAGGILIIISAGIIRQISDLKRYLYSVFGFLYPTLFTVHLILISDLGTSRLVLTALLLDIVAVSASDMFAYFIGMIMGRTPLCPAISPKKTVEGSAGGLAAAVLGAVVLKFIVDPGQNISIVHYIIIGVLCGFFSQCGDLIASVIKRSVGIKDYAGILPGMGGIMDRVDGIVFCSPLIYYYFIIILGL